MLTVPLFFIGFILTQVDFSIIWRYMAWSNQTLATIVLWTITVYLAVNKKFYWLTLLPSVFMTAVVTAYLLVAPEGFKMNVQTGQIIGVCLSIVTAIVFMIWNYQKPKTKNQKPKIIENIFRIIFRTHCY